MGPVDAGVRPAPRGPARARLAATRPVLLVPGWSDGARALRAARSHLLASGWRDEQVGCVDFQDRFGSNLEHARELAAAVRALLTRTGATELDVVCHSMGGLALRRLLMEEFVPLRTAVFAGTPHRGTWSALLAWGAGAPEMRPGSVFLRELSQCPLPSPVRAWCLRTPLDTHVIPGGSAWLPGAYCITVSAPLHQLMLRHEPTLRTISRILRAG